MKKHLFLLIEAILLLFAGCDLFNPSPDPKQNQNHVLNPDRTGKSDYYNGFFRDLTLKEIRRYEL